MTPAAIDVQKPLAYSGSIIRRTKAMPQAKTRTRLSFTELLVWHAIKGRAVNGVAVATDRLIAQETALSPSMVRDTRRGLQAAEMIACRMVAAGRVEADDELVIVLAPGKAAAP